MVIGDKGSVVICDGDVIGGTNQEDSAFSGVVVRAGGKLNMAGGSIKGGDGSESGSRGVNLSVVGDGDDATSTTSTTSTATIVGGNIAAGTEPGLPMYVGNATVNVWGGTLGSHWVVADGGTVNVYGKDLIAVRMTMAITCRDICAMVPPSMSISSSTLGTIFFFSTSPSTLTSISQGRSIKTKNINRYVLSEGHFAHQDEERVI
jgi:hypothetical protein